MKLHLLLPIVLVTAKLLGGLGRRLGVPTVVGEILAGVLLGPTVIGAIPTSSQDPERFAQFEELG